LFAAFFAVGPWFMASCGTDDCCKNCDLGKACGDTCIDADLECHQPSGCACDG